MLTASFITDFQHAFASGQTIAYPTEAVFGLGCDPDNDEAIARILSIKTRPQDKGVILIASQLAQLTRYVDISALTTEQWDTVQATWPGPYTWIIPKRTEVSELLSGGRATLAVRLSAHPVVRQLCDAVDKPMVSTSANPSGLEPARDIHKIAEYFADSVFVVDGPVDRTAQPSKIQDAVTGQVLRG
jgi:L-threonylcarbamoyladenylate synthase